MGSKYSYSYRREGEQMFDVKVINKLSNKILALENFSKQLSINDVYLSLRTSETYELANIGSITLKEFKTAFKELIKHRIKTLKELIQEEINKDEKTDQSSEN